MLSPNTQHKISAPVRIVIPAYKAGNSIQACLNNALTACDYFSDIEVVVVAYDTKIDRPFDHRLRIIEPHKPLNAGQARNLGAQNGYNRILVFIDADVLIEPHSLPKLLCPIMNNEADATVGNYATDLVANKFFQNYKKIYINQAYAREGYITNEFWTAYAAISGKAFNAVGGFSEQFRFKGGEDTEIGVRLSAQLFKIYAVAGVYGKHLKDFNFGSLINNDFVKGSRTVFLALHRKMALQENRHAKKNDQVAVAIACSMVLLIAAGFLMHWVWLFMPLATSTYIASRFNFLTTCANHSYRFALGAFLVAWCLDIVRAASIANGIIIYFWVRWINPQNMSAPVIPLNPKEEVNYMQSRA